MLTTFHNNNNFKIQTPIIITDDDRLVSFDLTLEKYYGNTWGSRKSECDE